MASDEVRAPDGSGAMAARGHRPWLSVAALVAAPLAVIVGTLVIARSPDHDDQASAPGGRQHDGHHEHTTSGSGVADPGQIEAIRAAMARYQDIEVARADGWDQEHADTPGTGAHFAQPGEGDDGDLDLTQPEFLMYSRLGRDDWELVAVAYVVDQDRSPEPPTELDGAVYHQHVWNCIVDGEELDEEDFGTVSRDECRAQQGEWSPGGVWMTHVWLIDNPAGTFAETNPDLA